MNTEGNVGAQGTRAARPRGWWSRNWQWFVPLAMLGSLLVCAGIVFAVLSRYKWSEPYLKALEKVQTHPQVIAKLGEPIEGVFWPPPTGELQTENDRGDANLVFQVQGPKGKADVHTQARRIAGRWGLSLLVVSFPDGKRLKIDLGEESGLEAPPQWKPGPPSSEQKPEEKKSEEAPPPTMEFQVPEK
jgi:hypothetical protein